MIYNNCPLSFSQLGFGGGGGGGGGRGRRIRRGAGGGGQEGGRGVEWRRENFTAKPSFQTHTTSHAVHKIQKKKPITLHIRSSSMVRIGSGCYVEAGFL